MKRGYWIIVIVLIPALLGSCGLVEPEPELTPQEVVTKFYRWYIGYPANPLVDKAYRDSPYLATSFIQQVDETLASFELGGADPFLLAQDIPVKFTVGGAELADDRAVVSVDLYWGGNPDPSVRQVELHLIDGEWKITGVSFPD